ncbi:LysR family transcriptional regulator [Sphingomonas morindae]|uniref:LysR family transcriptional regulator n=1 Tax=Sphingomonas morindae TaxID=1541170 RepID=A0ABY4XCL4_9SPHN|nr:LysR family transcriptional regulator [Sphingomonas morindae]USI74702.1 LysR family transcriptional regulator [Sphingomonas morindae]
MLKLDGLEAFVTVVEAGSISAAARRLGCAKSVVSDRLAELERTIGAQLVQRTTRSLALTGDGDALLVRARSILRDVADAEAEVAERRGALAGPLRIAGPISFGALHLGPAIYGFLATHPGIQLTLDLDDRFVDAAADGYDAVIRHGPITDGRLIVKHLASSRRILVASPAYLARRGTPKTVADLAQACAILYTNREADWRFPAPGGDTILRPLACLRVNNGLLMRDAALAGLGITLLPTFFVHRELANGSLVNVDVGAEAEGATIHLAYPANRSPSAKLGALVAWLRTAFGSPAYWDASAE